MDDETILARGGDERDIEELAKQNGADLTKEDVEREEVIRFWDRAKQSLSTIQQERIKARVLSGWGLIRAIRNEGVMPVVKDIEQKHAKDLFKEGLLKIDEQKKEVKKMTPAGSAPEGVEGGISPDALCIWCGKKYSEHLDERPEGAPVPRVPCLLLKDSFKQ